MKLVKLLGILFILLNAHSASAERIDSFQINRTCLRLNLQNLSSKTLKGQADLSVKWNINTNVFRLDLRQLLLDSVKVDQAKVAYQRIGESINIQLGQSKNKGDSSAVQIYYHGSPALDPGGWGGFYFNGNYAFNLGVGFTVKPHSFGRAWMPCVDEFTMKSAYEFFVETDSNFRAACNGLLLGCEIKPQSKIWHFKETVPMSAYLAAVSVSQYGLVETSYSGINSTFPIELFAAAIDTTNVKSSFTHLPNAINCFEKSFGPQPYSKVGYNFVPFNGGAMEHAGNITFPKAFANGSLNYETMMAHELSHHWWGDHVTCSTAEDMWLNEGWASYCEHLFTENVYGKLAYKQSILNNHLFVLRFAHVNDANIFSLVNIPHDYTYGNHVYKKGADVIHSLRSVMGDSNFFAAAKSYQSQFALKNASTPDMQSVFEGFDQKRANSFFNQWVKTPGCPHISIVKQVHTNVSGPHLRIYTQQKSRFNSTCYTDLPIEVFFYKNIKEFVKRTIIINNCQDSFDFDLPFKPIYVALDLDEKLSDAISDQAAFLIGSSAVDLPATFSKFYPKHFQDTAFLRVEHHWVGPELYRTTAPYMSDYRYYTLDGIWNNEATDSLDLELTYDGRMGGVNSNLGYLDHTLIKKTEDSLRVLYRAFPGDYWRIWPNFKLATGSKNDKQGKLTVLNAKRGDYVLAMYDASLAIRQNQNKPEPFKLIPNPSQKDCQIEWPQQWIGQFIHVVVSNVQGQIVLEQTVEAKEARFNFTTEAWSNGLYQIQIDNSKHQLLQTLVKS